MMRRTSVASYRHHRGFAAAFACLLLAAMPSAGALSQALPEVFDTAEGELVTAAEASKKHRRRQKRPVLLGTSGGSVEAFTVDPPSIVCCGGTLGALLRKGDRHFILSNNHVLGRVNQASIGESISQPGLLDANCEAPGRNLVGTLSDFKRLKLKAKNTVDAAIAETSLDDVSADGGIIGIGVPGNRIVKPRIGTAVIKSGRTTGVTRSEVIATNVTGSVTFPEECGSDVEVEVQFKKVFLVGGGDFSAGGDSGSVIYEDVPDCPRAMGLLFAGTDSFTAANPMNLVMKAVKKMKPKGAADLVGCTPAAAGLDRLTARAADRAERSAMRVQRGAEDGILAVPGVVAMGIGHAADQSGRVVFRVLLEDARPEAAAALPRSIEGVPVEVVVSGKLRALSCPSEGPPVDALGGLETEGPREQRSHTRL